MCMLPPQEHHGRVQQQQQQQAFFSSLPSSSSRCCLRFTSVGILLCCVCHHYLLWLSSSLSMSSSSNSLLLALDNEAVWLRRRDTAEQEGLPPFNTTAEQGTSNSNSSSNDTIHTSIRHMKEQLQKLQKQVTVLEQRVDRRVKIRDLQGAAEWTSTLPTTISSSPSYSQFCMPWHISMDAWWTHHYEYEVGMENDTHYCFQRIQDQDRLALLQELHSIQFPSTTSRTTTTTSATCTNVTTKRMLNAGFGADLDHIVDGLLYALQSDTPFGIVTGYDDQQRGKQRGKQRQQHWWHYAANKRDGSNATCPTKDVGCYFLPLSSCPPNVRHIHEEPFLTDGYRKQKGIGKWLLDYAMRPQTWLRRDVYFYKRSVMSQWSRETTTASKGSSTSSTVSATSSIAPCTVFHVRRADVVLHGKWSRKYRAIDEYVSAMRHYNMTSDNPNKNDDRSSQQQSHNILLLTDDANAITEAIATKRRSSNDTNTNTYNWLYIPRKRHFGPSGGFEQQVPSDNPKQEVIILLSILQLVQQCHSLVHTTGNFAELLVGAMTTSSSSSRANSDTTRVQIVNLDDLEENKTASLFSLDNALTVNVSRAYE